MNETKESKCPCRKALDQLRINFALLGDFMYSPVREASQDMIRFIDESLSTPCPLCDEVKQLQAAVELYKATADQLRAQFTEAAACSERFRQGMVEAQHKGQKLLTGIAWAYQAIGARWPNQQAMDNLSALSQGKDPPHKWPVVPPPEGDMARMDWMEQICIEYPGEVVNVIGPDMRKRIDNAMQDREEEAK